MICDSISMLDAPEAARHGPEYRAAILQSARSLEGGIICIDEGALNTVRVRFGLPALPGGEAAALLPRLRRFAASLLRWCRSGCPLTPARLYRRRAAICATCPHWLSAGTGAGLSRCARCGCATALKLRMLTERCPDTPPRW